jgi:hypothetical protein
MFTTEILQVRKMLERNSLKNQFINYFKSSFKFRFSVIAIIILIVGLLIDFVPWTRFPLEAGILAAVGYLIITLIKALKLKEPVSRWYIFEIGFWIFISTALFIDYLLTTIS